MEFLDIIEYFHKSLKTVGSITQRIASLSTMPLSENDFPASRIVVLREFDAKEMVLTVFTHALSDKVEEIAKNPNSTIVWYDQESGLQIQFYCMGKIEVESDQVDQYIENLKEHSYKDYFGPKPGSLLSEEQKLLLENPQNISRDQIRFCLLRFEVQKMVCLKLGVSKHEKVLFENFEHGVKKEVLVP